MSIHDDERQGWHDPERSEGKSRGIPRDSVVEIE